MPDCTCCMSFMRSRMPLPAMAVIIWAIASNCLTRSFTSFGCTPPDDECAWGTYQAECVDGVKIRFCDDGKLTLYDCRDVGANSCAAGSSGVNCTF